MAKNYFNLRTNKDVTSEYNTIISEIEKLSEALEDNLKMLGMIEGVDFKQVKKDYINPLQKVLKLAEEQNEHWSELKAERVEAGTYDDYCEGFNAYDDFCRKLSDVMEHTEEAPEDYGYYVDANCQVKAVKFNDYEKLMADNSGLAYIGSSREHYKFFFHKGFGHIKSLPKITWDEWETIIKIVDKEA